MKDSSEAVSKFFDAEWYIQTYKDVALSGLDPLTHYEKYGRVLNRAINGGSKNVVTDEAKNKLVLDNHPDAEAFVKKTLSEFKGHKSFGSIDKKLRVPKVSFVVTSFNAEDSIERSVHSLLMQNYPDLEVIVCDDGSTDSTWEILKRLQAQSPSSLKVFRTNVNGGTYLAKNIAIAESSGDVILFQDSDDYSHPDRTLVQVLPLLLDKELVATRTKYLRFDPETKKVIPVANLYSKYGLITLAVWRKAFEEIGYFDAVRKAGDDEWFQRLGHLYGKGRIKTLDVTLYLAELRQNSLIADMLKFKADGSVDQSSSMPRKNYVKIFQSRFNNKNNRRQWYKNNFSTYPLRPQKKYPDSIFAIEAPEEKIYASACCIPSRKESFKKVVQRILPQVDELFVYLDKFDSIPDYLDNKYKITVIRSQDVEFDFRDNAKFLMFNELRKRGQGFYYFTFDDDILYPYDYVRSMIHRLRIYNNKIVAGVHGVIYEEKPKKYFKRRFIYHFQDADLAQPELVNNLGTGTVAFHSKCFETLDPRAWDLGGMVDIFFSKECKRAGVPMLCVDHHANWLVSSEESEGTPNLFNEFKEKEIKIVKELQNDQPWGYKAISDVLSSPKLKDLGLEALLPDFYDHISVSSFFPRYR